MSNQMKSNKNLTNLAKEKVWFPTHKAVSYDVWMSVRHHILYVCWERVYDPVLTLIERQTKEVFL